MPPPGYDYFDSMRIMLADAWEHRSNHFTLLRLLAAAAVIVSHAYLIAGGTHMAEPLMTLTGFTLGQHAVNVFFGISGFLVMASWERRPDAIAFVTARTLRIFPALIVAALALVLVLGPILTHRNPLEYAISRESLSYLLRTVLALDGEAYLPGAFDSAPAGREAMVTVWTLKYEVACYAGLLLLGVFGLAGRRWVVATLAALGLLMALGLGLAPKVAALHAGIHHTVRFATCFWLGMAAWRFRDRIPVDLGAALAILAAAAMLVGTALFDPLIYLAEVYGALVLALGPLPLALADLKTDVSYGLYLYGYPVEQTLAHYVPGMSAPVIAVAAMAVTAIVALMSWHYVEHPAIRAKAAITERVARILRRGAPVSPAPAPPPAAESR